MNDIPRLAVLIDADNVQDVIMDGLLRHIGTLGDAVVKRIYGDFTTPHNARWKENVRKFGIKPIQQFSNTAGKNASDSMLIIDAMDLLHKGGFDGFCVVSSDADFTSLATRLKEDGLKVFGFGAAKTPLSFQKACTSFVEVEQFLPDKKPKTTSPSPKKVTVSPKAVKAAGVAEKSLMSFPVDFLKKAIREVADAEGWVHLGSFGSRMNKLDKDFDTRKFGFKKLIDMIQSREDLFEATERPGKKPNTVSHYVRLKK